MNCNTHKRLDSQCAIIHILHILHILHYSIERESAAAAVTIEHLRDIFLAADHHSIIIAHPPYHQSPLCLTIALSRQKS